MPEPETRQRWIGPDGDWFFDWESAWVLDVTLPDGRRIHLTHESGQLPKPVL